MTRYAIDSPTALRLIREGRTVHASNSLVAPSGLRSEVLVALYRLVRAGEIEARDGRELLERLAELKMRLLNDRVTRAVAWKIAMDNDWDDPVPAEYLAVAKLQADALITDNPQLLAGAQEVIRIARYDDLFSD